MKPTWEEVTNRDADNHDRVRRMAVPGGWLYQVHAGCAIRMDPLGRIVMEETDHWHAPVFVPWARGEAKAVK